MTKSVMITGVSSGIGYATAQILLQRGYRVFGSVRNDTDAARVSAAFETERFTAVVLDVTDMASISLAATSVQGVLGDAGLDALINNSGIAHVGPLAHTPIAEFQQVLDINVTGVLRVTQAFLPLLKIGTPGRIVNISSISGGVTFPILASYAVSKHALESLTDGMRRELSIYNIKVSAIEPGTIKTPIWDKAPKQDVDTRFADTDYAATMAAMPAFVEEQLKSAKPIAVVIDAIVHALESRRPKIRYPLTGLWHLRKILSDRLLDKMIIRAVGLSKKRDNR